MGAVVGIRSLAGVESRICEGCRNELRAEAFYLKDGRINSTLCKRCTVADNKLRRENPDQHRQVKDARVKAREEAKAALEGQVLAKPCSQCRVEKNLREFRETERGLYGRSSWCRVCERQYTRDWTDEHREDHNAKRRATWSAKDWTPEEREAAAKRSREWYANPENKERHDQWFYRWAKENNQAINAINQKRRARKLAADATLTSNEWLQVLDYFNRSCAYCLSSSEEMTMDHMVPLSRGGTHTADNVVPACRFCNSRKGTRSILVMLGT
jgi:hypothetical protein